VDYGKLKVKSSKLKLLTAKNMTIISNFISDHNDDTSGIQPHSGVILIEMVNFASIRPRTNVRKGDSHTIGRNEQMYNVA
jgi:hypothetical protein